MGARRHQGLRRPQRAEAGRAGDRAPGGSRPAEEGALTELARLRGASQLFHRPTDLRHPADVARLAGPIQAQEPRAARLAFRARSSRLTAADVDRARTEERSLLRTWMMRRTVHLIPSEDAGWLVPLFADSIVALSRRRLGMLGLEPRAQDRALELMVRSVDREGPLTRPELLERLGDAGFAAANEAKYHLWALAVLEGDLCLGPDRDGQTCLVRTRDWVGELERRPREDSLAELARRYVRAYGPTSERDLARWAGLPLRDCRGGFERIASELIESRVGSETLLVCKRGRRRAPRRAIVRLLGAFDNYNLGYSSRDFALPDEHRKQLAPGGGIIRPAITIDGWVAGTWSSKRSGRRLSVTLEPFGELDPATIEAIEADVKDIGRFEGLAARLD